MAGNLLDRTTLPSSDYDDAVIPVAKADPENTSNPLARKLDREGLQDLVLTVASIMGQLSNAGSVKQYATALDADDPVIITRTFEFEPGSSGSGVANTEFYVNGVGTQLYLGRVNNSSFLNGLDTGTEIIIEQGDVKARIKTVSRTALNSQRVYYTSTLIDGSLGSLVDGDSATLTIAEPDDWHTSKTASDKYVRVGFGSPPLYLPGTPIGFDLHDDVGTALTSLATGDRIIVSDESATGDPNRYATLETLISFIANASNVLTAIEAMTDEQQSSTRDALGIDLAFTKIIATINGITSTEQTIPFQYMRNGSESTFTDKWYDSVSDLLDGTEMASADEPTDVSFSPTAPEGSTAELASITFTPGSSGTIYLVIELGS